MPLCESTPVRFNTELYEYMCGPSEFLATGTLRDHNGIDRLAEINIPSLFLVGEHDEVRPETMLEFQALVPGSVVKVIPGAAHISNIDNPQAFDKAMEELFSTVEARQATTPDDDWVASWSVSINSSRSHWLLGSIQTVANRFVV